jgi:hypothetical protein
MTPIEILALVPLLAFFSLIWGTFQTEEINAKAYRQENPELWVETKHKVKKPKYPDLFKPVLTDEPEKKTDQSETKTEVKI